MPGLAESDPRLRSFPVYAHVADTASHASGTMAIHASLGDRVVFAICTDSVRMHPTLFLDFDEAPGRATDLPYVPASVEQMRALRRREAIRAAAILGVNEVVFMGWDDDGLELNSTTVGELASLILKVRPDVLVTHCPMLTSARPTPTSLSGRSSIGLGRSPGPGCVRSTVSSATTSTMSFLFSPRGGGHELITGIVCDIWVDITSVVDRKGPGTRSDPQSGISRSVCPEDRGSPRRQLGNDCRGSVRGTLPAQRRGHLSEPPDAGEPSQRTGRPVRAPWI